VGGALLMITDLTVWMQNGPAAMVRALDLFERRQVVFRASVSAPPPGQSAERLRIQVAAGALGVSGLFFTATGGWKELVSGSFSAYITLVFVASWILWLLVLLWRQFRSRPVSTGAHH